MLLKEAINRIPGLRSLVVDLDIRFTPARRMLYETEMETFPEGVERRLERLDAVYRFYTSEQGRSLTERIKIRLDGLRDISGTLARLEEGVTISDIEFFEVKSFALLSGEIRDMTAEMSPDVIEIADPRGVIRILDPRDSGSSRFAVYDHFMPPLAEVRTRMRELRNGTEEADPTELGRLKEENSRLEDLVREQLSAKLRPFVGEMRRSILTLSELDILLAQSAQAVSLKLRRPVISTVHYDIEGLFNPEVAASLAGSGRSFQGIDISFGPCPTLITGANMAGKSVILKSVALAQAMMQFGFYVPAHRASLPVVDHIVIISGDTQSERDGLSSFASEIKRLTEATSAVNAGRKLLFLYDEPARTTNPSEGQALVNAIVRFLNQKNVYSLITTHYSGIESPRRLRVRGLEGCHATFTEPGELLDAMDYRLREEVTDEAPNEAIRIAKAFGADGEIISYAEQLIQNRNKTQNEK